MLQAFQSENFIEQIVTKRPSENSFFQKIRIFEYYFSRISRVGCAIPAALFRFVFDCHKFSYFSIWTNF